MYGNSRLSSSENSLRTSEKNLKKIVFNTSKPLLQHPLCGILRRAGPKNGQNGPSSFVSIDVVFVRDPADFETLRCDERSKKCIADHYIYSTICETSLIER